MFLLSFINFVNLSWICSLVAVRKIFNVIMYAFIYPLITVVVPLLVSVAFYTVGERKIMGSVHRRTGPSIVGVFGQLQAIADGLKLVIKEILIPRNVNLFIYLFSPYLVIFLSFVLWGVIPVNTYFVHLDLSVSLLYLLSFGSLGVFGIFLAGWASNSNYAFLGGVRSVAQIISYELSLGFLMLSVVILTGSANLLDIIFVQQKFGWYLFPLFPLFLIFLIIMLAETNRTPFDLPEAEAELVAGFNLEYSGILFALFFLGEYGNMILMALLAVLLFLGGWDSGSIYINNFYNLGVVNIQEMFLNLIDFIGVYEYFLFGLVSVYFAGANKSFLNALRNFNFLSFNYLNVCLLVCFFFLSVISSTDILTFFKFISSLFTQFILLLAVLYIACRSVLLNVFVLFVFFSFNHMSFWFFLKFFVIFLSYLSFYFSFLIIWVLPCIIGVLSAFVFTNTVIGYFLSVFSLLIFFFILFYNFRLNFQKQFVFVLLYYSRYLRVAVQGWDKLNLVNFSENCLKDIRVYFLRYVFIMPWRFFYLRVGTLTQNSNMFIINNRWHVKYLYL